MADAALLYDRQADGMYAHCVASLQCGALNLDVKPLW